MKYIVLLLGLIVTTIDLSAQQMPIFSQYRENHALLNPAITHSDFIALGYKPQNTLGITYRNQWTGLMDAPKTFTVRYEHIFDRKNFLIGGALLKDETGPTGTTGGYGRYAYLIRFSKNAFLSLGTSVGFQQYRYEPNKGILRDEGDILGFTPGSVTSINAAFGGYFQTTLYNNDKIYSGLSILQFAQIYVNNGSYQPKRVPHIYWHGGLYHYLSDGFGDWIGSLFLEPSVWLKYVPNAPMQLDTNLRFQMSGVFFVGLGYSFALSNYNDFQNIRGNNFIFEGGLTFGEDVGLNDAQLKIGYSFARSIATYGVNLGYSHEINVTYAWGN